MIGTKVYFTRKSRGLIPGGTSLPRRSLGILAYGPTASTHETTGNTIQRQPPFQSTNTSSISVLADRWQRNPKSMFVHSIDTFGRSVRIYESVVARVFQLCQAVRCQFLLDDRPTDGYRPTLWEAWSDPRRCTKSTQAENIVNFYRGIPEYFLREVSVMPFREHF